MVSKLFAATGAALAPAGDASAAGSAYSAFEREAQQYQASLAPALAPGEGNLFALLVDAQPVGRQQAIEAIRAGYPARLLKDASSYFDVPASRIRSIVHLPETTAATLIKRGARLDAAVSERIWRLADLAYMARDLFEDQGAALAWLRTPNRSFQGGAPIDYLDTEPGAMSVRQVLNAMATGGAA